MLSCLRPKCRERESCPALHKYMIYAFAQKTYFECKSAQILIYNVTHKYHLNCIITSYTKVSLIIILLTQIILGLGNMRV